jgi:hypothetical protein
MTRARDLANWGDQVPNAETAWTSYTPTFTNLTVGNGTIAAAYKQIGKTVFVRVSFAMGSTSSISGPIVFSLPITSIVYSTNFAAATAYIEDAAVAGYSGTLQIQNTTSARLFAIGTAGTYGGSSDTSSTVPMTWATNDFFRTQFFYEAA